MSNSKDNNLRLLRYWRGMSQIELADAARCSQGTVSNCENRRQRISPSKRKAFADALDVDESMIEGPVTIIPKLWDELVSDPRMPIIINEILSYDSKQRSRLVHSISEQNQVHNFAL